LTDGSHTTKNTASGAQGLTQVLVLLAKVQARDEMFTSKKRVSFLLKGENYSKKYLQHCTLGLELQKCLPS
jgi:hypothetical protein